MTAARRPPSERLRGSWLAGLTPPPDPHGDPERAADRRHCPLVAAAHALESVVMRVQAPATPRLRHVQSPNGRLRRRRRVGVGGHPRRTPGQARRGASGPSPSTARDDRRLGGRSAASVPCSPAVTPTMTGRRGAPPRGEPPPPQAHRGQARRSLDLIPPRGVGGDGCGEVRDQLLEAGASLQQREHDPRLGSRDDRDRTGVGQRRDARCGRRQAGQRTAPLGCSRFGGTGGPARRRPRRSACPRWRGRTVLFSPSWGDG